MRLYGLLVLTCVLTVGCGSDDDSTAPSNANPNTITFTSTLLPANEVPPVSNAENSGRGTAVITFNLTRTSAGAIQSGTVDFHFDLTNFPANTTITAAHIHNGPAGQTAAVFIGTPLTAASALGLPNGSGSWEARGVTVSDVTALQSIIDNPAGFYFNVHSTTNPGGVARGQLVRQ
jgi:hypothetical protein